MPGSDGACTGDDTRSAQVAEPVEDIEAPRLDMGQVPSPPASLPAMELGPRVE